jgi:hypothetical protein
MTKFAAITSSLLARKGEAAPWADNDRAPLDWRTAAPPPPVMASPPPRAVAVPSLPLTAPDQVKRCTVKLSHRDYERLGIMAVKKDVTRQQFLQSALSRVLDELAHEFPTGCSCIGGNCAGPGCGQGCDERKVC